MADQLFDIAVIGAGPAGLSAALTARVRNKTVALFEHMDFSPKLQKAHAINNYPGLPMTAGKDLMKQMADHCLSTGPTLIKEKVTNIYSGDTFTLLTPNNTFEAKALVLAIGVSNSAMLVGEKELVGKGVCYCATCDGMLYRDKPVAVIAYTEEGEHEADFLGEICPVVYFIPQYKTEFVPKQPTVQIMKARPQAVLGSDEVTGLQTDVGELKVDGIFILRQSDPAETLLPELEMDGLFVKVNRDQATNVSGVYAAGDCTGKPWQIARAAGEGLVAALNAISFIDSKK
jgi:thioredoxin reductase (NADPH)